MGINEYLGELYVQTNRIDKANERLKVLKIVIVMNFKELELIIKTRGASLLRNIKSIFFKFF